MEKKIPEDAQFIESGIHYKVGRFSYIYMWVRDEWIRSNKNYGDLRKMREITLPGYKKARGYLG